MLSHAILYPVVALAFWTFVVLTLIPIVRTRAGLRQEIRVSDFKYGEAETVPKYVSVPNRNYMNLLELPVLFYVGCLLLYVTAGASPNAVALAWAFVALRVLHSAIHLTYNHVVHRLTAFAASNVALVSLWVLAALHLVASPAR